jgi:hypothetical protein
MPAPAEARARGAGPAGARRWRSRAFGLEIEGDFPAPGLPPSTARRRGPRTRIELAAPEDIDRDWPVDEAERLVEECLGGRTAARTIDRHPRAGYRLYARHFGLAHISAEGARIVCAPPDVAPWRWQRFLVGRVLPWASLLRGHEVFHASAVRLGDGAVAVIGPSGAGKTSIAVQLVLRGAGFITDDVLALERTGADVLAHPGASIASVRPAERDAIPRTSWRALGTVLGHHEKTYVELPREAEPWPLRAIYYLVPREGCAAGEIAPTPPDPRQLLGSTFVLSVQTPQRLRNQLEVCADLAHTARTYTATVDPRAGAATLAEAILAHAGEHLGEATCAPTTAS